MTAFARTRTLRLMALAALVVFSVAACAKKETQSEEVREFLDATMSQARRYVYTETTPDGHETVVQGIVEDDFRYKAQMTIDGEPIVEQVISDDTAAVRFLEPDLLARFIDKDVVTAVDPATDVEGINVFTALQARRWVVDEAGATPVLRSVDDQTDRGIDPIADAQEVLRRAHDTTFFTEGGFIEYSPDSISPLYRADEDPFPRPEDGSEVVRYDFPQGRFPVAADSGQIALPGEGPFRKYSVYVKDGRVIRVAEDIGVAPTVLDNFERFMLQLIRTTAPDDIAAGFEAALGELDGQDKADFLLQSLNTLRELRGDPAIRFRTSVYEILDPGDTSLRVEIPTEDVIRGDLAVLVNLGVKPITSGDDTGGESDADGDPGGVPPTVLPEDAS